MSETSSGDYGAADQQRVMHQMGECACYAAYRDVGCRLLDVVVGLRAEYARLRRELDDAQLRSIEARNPGIDMGEVRRTRAQRVLDLADDVAKRIARD